MLPSSALFTVDYLPFPKDINESWKFGQRKGKLTPRNVFSDSQDDPVGITS